jgi:serine phosphatase RsbU (regulator of sigma subunit)
VKTARGYSLRIAREPVLTEPPPSLRSLQELSGPALLAITLAGVIAVLDGAAGGEIVLLGLLAIPPVIAAMGSSVPETGIVGAASVVLALLSGLWNENFGSTPYVVEVMTVIAGSIAGLWIAALREEAKREKISADLLAEAGAVMEQAMDQRARAQEIARLAVPALGDVVMIDVMTPARTIERLAATSGDPALARRFLDLRERTPIRIDGPHPVARVIRTGEPLELGHLTDELIAEITTRESERELLEKHRFRSCLVLPLRARGAVLGAITLWITRRMGGFDEVARRTAHRLSERAALALDNAHLHEQQAHIAGVLQHNLLPRSLPDVPGFEVASYFLAAGEAGYEVGGDFYDVFRSGSDSWNVVIGDVCGKGPEAAALTALARYTVRTASGPEAPPSAVLRVLHDSISADRSDLRFCTAALLRLDQPADPRSAAPVTVALGGHPQPLVLRGEGGVENVGHPGTLLGAIPDPGIADEAAKLAPGDAIVLYTDGLLAGGEVRPGGDEEGWLAAELAKVAGDSPQRIAERVASAAIRRQGGEPRDDIALLVIRRRPRRPRRRGAARADGAAKRRRKAHA